MMPFGGGGDFNADGGGMMGVFSADMFGGAGMGAGMFGGPGSADGGASADGHGPTSLPSVPTASSLEFSCGVKQWGFLRAASRWLTVEPNRMCIYAEANFNQVGGWPGGMGHKYHEFDTRVTEITIHQNPANRFSVRQQQSASQPPLALDFDLVGEGMLASFTTALAKTLSRQRLMPVDDAKRPLITASSLARGSSLVANAGAPEHAGYWRLLDTMRDERKFAQKYLDTLCTYKPPDDHAKQVYERVVKYFSRFVELCADTPQRCVHPPREDVLKKIKTILDSVKKRVDQANRDKRGTARVKSEPDSGGGGSAAEPAAKKQKPSLESMSSLGT